MVSNLIVIPVLLPIWIAMFLACLCRRRSITNRLGMLGAVGFLAYFLFSALCALINNVYLHQVYKDYPTCWQSDDTMVKLGKMARHAHIVVLGIEIMGLIGASM
jgi:hypothetical protein